MATTEVTLTEIFTGPAIHMGRVVLALGHRPLNRCPVRWMTAVNIGARIDVDGIQARLFGTHVLPVPTT